MKILKKTPFILSLLLRGIYNQNRIQFDNIEIIDFNKKKNNSEKSLFDETIMDSLKLIKQLSPIKYQRVLKQIDSIVYSKRINEDSFSIKNKFYITNGFVQWKDSKLMHIYYAGVLIYLSTYRCLLSEKTDYYMEDKLKIYDISIRAEKQFYKKVENLYPEYKNTLIKKFLED